MRTGCGIGDTIRRTAGLGLALLLAACATPGNAPAPAPLVPKAFTEPVDADAAMPTTDGWNAFGSAELSSLVAAAMNANPDLAIAAERVRQAEAQVRIAGATLFPVVNLGADSSRRDTRVDGGNWQAGNASSATLNARYEVDLWNKNASTVRSAEATHKASRFDRESLGLTIKAGVASAYFQILSLRTRLSVARANLGVAERVFAVVDSRVRNGAASALDRARQQATVLTQRAAIPPLELQERQTLFALAILVGQAPEGFEIAGSTLAGVAVPRIAPGLPAQLLVRRPDLASAEAQLAAANANVAVARADLLPGIGLTGSGGFASDALLNFLKGPTASLMIGASLLQPIFHGGRLQAQTDAAAARERELVENYRKAVLAALADVESALAAGERTTTQERLQAGVLEQLRLALRLAVIRYREGAVDLLAPLDAQRTLFLAEDQAVQIRLSRLLASVGLFKALGGGWANS